MEMAKKQAKWLSGNSRAWVTLLFFTTLGGIHMRTCCRLLTPTSLYSFLAKKTRLGGAVLPFSPPFFTFHICRSTIFTHTHTQSLLNYSR